MNCTSKKQTLKGSIQIPGSKSHAIRAILLSTLAEGVSVIKNPPHSNDVMSALNCAKLFGAKVTEDGDNWIIEGTGGKLKTPDDVVNTGNSGTATTLLIAMSSLAEGYSVITGDYQIRRRPQKAMVDVLNELGANAVITRPDCSAPPIVVKGPLIGGEAHLSGFSSVFVSGTLVAAPLSKEGVTISVEKPLETPYIQMTIDWLRRYGVELSENSGEFRHFRVEGNQKYIASENAIPADWSSVAFPLVAAVTTLSDVEICGVDFDDCQGDKMVVEHIIAMGADITKDAENHKLIVHGGKPIKSNMTINLNDIPDSLPALSVAACYAEGTTTFTGLAHVRVKETDRVAVMERELKKIGADVETGPDYMIVHGGKPLTGAVVESYDDHRVAMAMAVAGLFSNGEMRVNNAECAAVSFPGFFDKMNAIGCNFQLSD